MSKRIDITGQRIGRLVVLRHLAERNRHGQSIVEVRCDCGAVRRIAMMLVRRVRGPSQSCGCLKRELSRARPSPKLRHGHAKLKTGGRAPTYHSWLAMNARCNRPTAPDFHRYGGRGIRICERWKSYEAFLDDMGDRPAGKTLDRRDNDGNYEPGNCRWATAMEQRHNQRPTVRRGRREPMGPRPGSPSTILMPAVAGLAEQGYSDAEIARRLGTTPSIAMVARRKLGMKRPPGGLRKGLQVITTAPASTASG